MRAIETSVNNHNNISSGKNLIFGLSVIVSLLVLFGISSNQFDALAYSTGSISVGSNPAGIAFNPANGNIYVANQGSNTISVISGSNNTVISTLSANSPQSIAFDSKGDVCYTARLGMTFDPVNGNLYVPDDNTNSEGGCISSSSSPTIEIVGSARDLPTGIAFDSANDNIYLTNQLQHTVSVIGTTNSFTTTINVGTEPVGVAFDSANGNIYVTNQGSGTVSVISGSSNNVTATINVGVEPVGIAIDSAKGKIYVANAGDNTLSVISDSTNTVINTIPVGSNPTGVAVNSANDNVYVTNSHSNTVYVISGLTKTSTVTALSSSLNPSLFGQSVTFTAAVSPSTATGTVTFTIDGTAQPPITMSGGIATLSSSSLSVGSHTIIAAYSGDTNDGSSISSTLTQTVKKATTTTTLTSSQNPSTFNQSVIFTASVSPSTATGTIQFSTDSTLSGSPVTIVGGQATFSSSSLTVGSHVITATYSGDTNFINSNNTLRQTVNHANSRIIVVSSANPSTFGHSITFTATVSPTDATGSMIFTIDGIAHTVSVSGGQASFNISTLSNGTHSINIEYSGDTNYSGDTSTLTQIVNSPSMVTPAPAIIQNSTLNVTNSSPTNEPTITPAEIHIPQWIHNNAKWWSEGTVGDKDFVQGIQYLIQQKVIVIPTTTQTVTVPSNQIPAWIKGVAGWWANGKISDDEFVKGIQFLVQVGIIKA